MHWGARPWAQPRFVPSPLPRCALQRTSPPGFSFSLYCAVAHQPLYGVELRIRSLVFQSRRDGGSRACFRRTKSVIAAGCILRGAQLFISNVPLRVRATPTRSWWLCRSPGAVCCDSVSVVGYRHGTVFRCARSTFGRHMISLDRQALT